MTTTSEPASPRAARPSTRTKRSFEIIIDEPLCRSCQICIAFCPTNVLASRPPLRKAEVVDIDACIGCRLCELLCPDWAVAMHEVTGVVESAAKD